MTVRLWPLATALLLAWEVNAHDVALDVGEVVASVRYGYEPELAWTWEAGPKWRAWDAAACLLATACKRAKRLAF